MVLNWPVMPLPVLESDCDQELDELAAVSDLENHCVGDFMEAQPIAGATAIAKSRARRDFLALVLWLRSMVLTLWLN